MRRRHRWSNAWKPLLPLSPLRVRGGFTSKRYTLKLKAAKYGFTLEEAEAMQKLGCAVCGGTKRLSFDHCHTTGEFRGMLCINCNIILGHAKDDAGRLRKLADYVEEVCAPLKIVKSS